MTLFNDDFEALTARDDDETIFSRDFNGQLIRLDAPTEADYDKRVTLQIDGQSVTVPLAEPLEDTQGNIVLDPDGKTTPRYTTIYDAASKLCGESGAENCIPVLCHQQHMRPVAVCRLCVVQIYGMKRGRRSPERKLLPACQHQVKDGMEVFTMNHPSEDGQRVRRAVACMTELLSADHLKMAPEPAPAEELAKYNELQKMMGCCDVKESRFKLPVLGAAARPPADDDATGDGEIIRAARRPKLDDSSPVFLVDHSACILCDRCSRACDEVKGNNVITRTGKGPTAGIAFDLNDAMGNSSCVQCGECMVSCPTSAITFRPATSVRIPASHDAELLSAAELIADPLFKNVPPKFLLWQNGLAVRRQLKANDELCRQGDPGNTAYLIRSGELSVSIRKKSKQAPPRGLLGFFKHSSEKEKPLFEATLTAANLIAGEMSALSGTPRTATLTAKTDGEVWEIRRNVLDRLMRTPALRDRINEKFAERALDNVLNNADLIQDMPADECEACNKFLRPKLKFLRANPRQLLVRQGDWADAAYIVRLGHVRVGISQAGSQGNRELNVVYLGPGAVFGEIALLGLSADDANKDPIKVEQELLAALREGDPNNLGAAWPSGQRTATCTALDHVEMASLSRSDFLRLVLQFPTIRRNLVRTALKRLREARRPVPLMRQFVAQGLYQGQSLLVLDLNSCTRCDECTKACVDQHGDHSHGQPITRLLREGLRFGDSLVATSCRSCKDAYCMIGCPVDAIHRGAHQQIVIEDHCIGCGLCEENCPYGNIFTPTDLKNSLEKLDPSRPGERVQVAQDKAAVCDLCDSGDHTDLPVPRCVNACPHDAAHRMTGEELFERVLASES